MLNSLDMKYKLPIAADVNINSRNVNMGNHETAQHITTFSSDRNNSVLCIQIESLPTEKRSKCLNQFDQASMN
jgi:hypothetical protein